MSSLAPTPAIPAASRRIEIECKLRWTPYTEQAVAKLGLIDAGPAESFVDTYLDDALCTLTTRDVWLRRRDQQWELKRPHSLANQRTEEQTRSAAAGLSRYQEQTDDAEICASLKEIFASSKPSQILQEMNISMQERSAKECELELSEVRV
jgi:hypothetical protein